MKKVIDKAIAYGVDYVYVTQTDAGYKVPPKYFNEEIEYIASKVNACW